MMPLLLALSAVSQATPDALVRGFKNPPASARPHTWWHWMDGNIAKGGITADLEAMKQAGIGGAHVFDVGQGVPAGAVEYNTPEWCELFAHAMSEAKRLGLEMTVHNCAGWSSSGGPWVEPKDAMKRVTWSVTEFDSSSSGRYPNALPQPQTTRGFYRDIAVYVFPSPSKPAGNPHPLPELTGMGANPGNVKQLNWPVVRRDAITELHVRQDGSLDHTFGPGKWTILRMGYTLTGSQNVASRDSGRGLEVDKLNADSFNAFFEGGPRKYLDRVTQGQTKSALTTVLVDSYETGYNNWTDGMRERFESRNGYAAAPFLPTLAGYAIDDESTTLGFLYDYRRNIASLWTENYSRLFANRLKPYDMQLAIEPYGNGNFDPFSYAKPAGLIMGEYWVGDSQLNPSVKHAASVAHVYGHSVVGAEALTATPDQAGWRNQPRQWKPFADKAMTTGINRVIYHRFAHQPWVSGVLPGMTMGPWGSHVDRTNTIWPYMPAWNQYLSRCQYLLQQGKFVGDVLLFTGEDSPQSYAGEGQDLPKVPEGYDYDFCGSDPLMSLRVKDHRLLLPNGASYAVLALPNTTAMSLPLARKIKQLVSEGAYVVGPKPTHSPSLSEASGTDELRRLAMDIWGNGLGQGKVYSGQSIGAVLKRLGVAKDFAAASGGVSAIHRRVGNREVFFVASNEPYPRTVACTFRAAGPMKVELWHPDTGLIEQAPVWSAGQGTIQIPLLFDADGSVFVVLSPGVPQSHLTSISVATSATAKPKPPLQIIKAVYGDFPSGKTADVTAILKRAASPFSLRIGATNGNMGGDPASMIVKTLQVTYEQGGVTKTVTVAENQILMIGDVPDAGTQPAYEISTKELVVWQSGLYRLARPHGAAATVAVRDMPPAQAVSGPWNVAFPAGWDAPPQVTFGKLMSWADHPDFAIKHFSGTATYTKELQVPESLLQANQRLMLDLGDVRELCRVRLNGKLLATLYKPPFRIDITKAAHIGQNELQIEVTNLWVNRLIGDEQFPDDMGWNGAQLSRWPDWFVNHQPRPEPRRKTFTTWRHNTKNTPLMPSGLIGPVVLSPAKIIRLR